MSPRIKRNEVGPGQDTLFTMQEINNQSAPNLQPVSVAASAEVNLHARAYHLAEALKELGIVRRSGGLDIATQPGSYLRDKIEDRYKSRTDDVIDRAVSSISEHRLKAKNHFAEASGLKALISSGLMAEDEAKKYTASEFDRFQNNFFGTKHNDSKRGKFKRNLDKQRNISR